MSTINDSDLLLVERNGNLHQITYDQMSTLNDDDILLVERGGVQYKVEAQYISTGPNGIILPSVEVLTPLNGAGLNDGQSYTPMSSAYLSTDSTPIYSRNFPERITTISGGSWVNENSIFDGNTSPYAELQGATGVVSQVVFTPHAGWFEGETYIWAYASGGGTIEILDDSDAVLRTYTLLTSSGGNTAVGIVRADQKIRFTTANQNESLYIANINRGPIDAEITGRVAFEFTDDTDLDKMVAPIIMTDENGNVKIPTTSTVDSTTTIPGENKNLYFSWNGNGTNKNFQKGQGYGKTPGGPRMVWAKTWSGYQPVIMDNVALGDLDTNADDYLLWTSETHGKQSAGDVVLADGESNYGPNSNYYNRNGDINFIFEVGVAPKILDIVTWDGNDASLREIPHNLGTLPGMIIIKCTNSSSNWIVWHKDLAPNKWLALNGGGSAGDDPARNPESPTKDKFYVGGNNQVNGGDKSYVAYVFAADTPGKIKCGSYIGAESNQLIDLGFKAGFFLTKTPDGAHSWAASTMDTGNQGYFWQPDNNQTLQGAGQNYFNHGYNNQYIQIRGNDSRINGNMQYVYLAIAADLTGPASTQLNLLSVQDLEYFTTGTQITSNASGSGSNFSYGATIYTGSGYDSNWVRPNIGGDRTWYDIAPAASNKWLVWIKCYTNGYVHAMFDSERDTNSRLESNSAGPQSYSTANSITPYTTSGGDAGYTVGDGSVVNRNGQSYISWNFKAAPQFFDVQKYKGGTHLYTGTGEVKHDLGVEPGAIIIKDINNNNNWYVWHSSLEEYQQYGVGSLLVLDSQNQAVNAGTWINTTDTGFSFTGQGSGNNNPQRAYISYIFAKDTPYVKCGSYIGSGSNTQVNVGFKPRWMLIKKADGGGDWVILDNYLSGQYTRANMANTPTSYSFNFTSTGVSLNGTDTNLNDPAAYVYIAIADEDEGSPPNFPSSTTVTETPDPNGAIMVVNSESFDVGATASAPALEASITSVGGVDGNKLLVDGSTGTWLPGLYAKGTDTTINAPGPDEITFTSQNQGTPAFSGVDATLASRTWTLESGTTATGPWTLVDSYVDYDVLNSQDGATPWSSSKPNLTPNTFYRVKVQYNSTNAESVESVYNTFKTGDA